MEAARLNSVTDSPTFEPVSAVVCAERLLDVVDVGLDGRDIPRTEGDRGSRRYQQLI